MVETTLYFIGALTPRVKSWIRVLEEEGYRVMDVASQTESASESRRGLEYGVITIALDDNRAIRRLCSEHGMTPKLAIHYAPHSLEACVLQDEPLFPLLIHLAEDQDEFASSLSASFPVSQLALPPSSADDEEAECESRYDGKSIRVCSYPNTSRERAGVWATALPFASQTATLAFDEAVGEWERSAAGMSYTRNIEAIKRRLGPSYDLERLWERHTRYEFQARDAGKTMKTMIAQPYVNHVSCMTGGTGYDELLRFYTNNFVTRTPPDTELVPISRTVGADRVVDEMVFRCTHTCEIDYFLPGVAPTGKRLEIFMVGIVNFRGPKLAFESLYWDQASVLVQLGLLDSKSLPCAGTAVGKKVLDPYRQPSNELFGTEARERSKR